MAKKDPSDKVENKSKEEPKSAAPPREPPEGFLRRTLLGSGGEQ